MPDNSFNRGCFMDGNLREKGQGEGDVTAKAAVIHIFPIIVSQWICFVNQGNRHKCGIVSRSLETGSPAGSRQAKDAEESNASHSDVWNCLLTMVFFPVMIYWKRGFP